MDVDKPEEAFEKANKLSFPNALAEAIQLRWGVKETKLSEKLRSEPGRKRCSLWRSNSEKYLQEQNSIKKQKKLKNKAQKPKKKSKETGASQPVFSGNTTITNKQLRNWQPPLKIKSFQSNTENEAERTQENLYYKTGIEISQTTEHYNTCPEVSQTDKLKSSSSEASEENTNPRMNFESLCMTEEQNNEIRMLQAMENNEIYSETPQGIEQCRTYLKISQGNIQFKTGSNTSRATEQPKTGLEQLQENESYESCFQKEHEINSNHSEGSDTSFSEKKTQEFIQKNPDTCKSIPISTCTPEGISKSQTHPTDEEYELNGSGSRTILQKNCNIKIQEKNNHCYNSSIITHSNINSNNIIILKDEKQNLENEAKNMQVKLLEVEVIPLTLPSNSSLKTKNDKNPNTPCINLLDVQNTPTEITSGIIVENSISFSPTVQGESSNQSHIPINSISDISSTNEKPQSLIGLQSNETTLVDKSLIQSNEPTLVDKSLIQSNKTTLVDKSLIQSNETTLVDKSLIQLNEPTLVDKSLIQLNEHTLVDKSLIQSNEPTLVDKSLIQSNETTLVDKSLIQSNEPTFLVKSVIESNETTLVDKSLIQSNETTLIGKSLIQSNEPILVDKSLIQSNEPTFLVKSVIQSNETTLPNMILKINSSPCKLSEKENTPTQTGNNKNNERPNLRDTETSEVLPVIQTDINLEKNIKSLSQCQNKIPDICITGNATPEKGKKLTNAESPSHLVPIKAREVFQLHNHLKTPTKIEFKSSDVIVLPDDSYMIKAHKMKTETDQNSTDTTNAKRKKLSNKCCTVTSSNNVSNEIFVAQNKIQHTDINLHKFKDILCKSPTTGAQAPYNCNIDNILEKKCSDSHSKRTSDWNGNNAVGNSDLSDDDFGLTGSQLLRIEDECRNQILEGEGFFTQATIPFPKDEAKVPEVPPINWAQKVLEKRQKLRCITLEISRLNALLTRVRKEMQPPEQSSSHSASSISNLESDSSRVANPRQGYNAHNM